MVHTQNTITYQTLGARDFADKIKSDSVYLLDVRTADEFKEGHIKGAHNLDVLNPDFMENAENMLPEDKTIAVYCGTGKRSGMASEKLTEAGYRILNLDGGLEAWKAAGLKLE